MAFFAAFNLFPTLFGLWLSFTDYDLLNPPIWVGLDNFANLFADRLFHQAFANTLVFVLGATLPVWVLSLLAALVFDQAFRGRDLLKAAFFLPVLPPVVVIAVVWRLLLHPNGVMTCAHRRLVGRHRDPLAGRCGARAVLDDRRA